MERGADSNYDLYEAFEAICRDEEAFRAQLTRYARPPNGQAPIRPIQVPAVVYNSFPGVMPTARNKMFNARLVESVLSDDWRTPTSLSMKKGDIESNWNALAGFLATGLSEKKIGASLHLIKRVGRDEFVRFLSELKWADGRDVIAAEREFFANNPHAAKDWLVMLPQLQERSSISLSGHKLSTHERGRKDEVFNIITSSEHVKTVNAEAKKPDGLLKGLGVALIYPTHEKPEHQHKYPFVGLAMYHPAVPATVAQAVFTVRNAKQRDEVVVKMK
jgi:hypothetical protein